MRQQKPPIQTGRTDTSGPSSARSHMGGGPSPSQGSSGPGSGPGGPRGKQEEPRVNRRIRVPEVRVISEESGQLGIMPTAQALRMAEAEGLDLVEIDPRSRPPVCKIMDFGKFKYQLKRKAAETKKRQQQVELKEVKFRPKTGAHDFEVKINSLKRFLEKGNKGKVTIMFRGREIVHPEIGKEILQRIIEALQEEAVVESSPRLEGKQMVMILAPAKLKKPSP